MEEKRLKEDPSCRRENDERKQPYTHRDIKRKLSLIKKKVDDLQHQRKITYKNSVKVKRVVHNQINQIVKCLRSRERFLWSEIDEMYLSQDEKISQELLRLQAIHSNCQTLFDHLEDNPQNAKDILSKIHSSLIRINYEDKLNCKALEFTSDFETLKTKASEFGILADFSFPKGDDFIFIDNDSSSNITCEKIDGSTQYFRKLYEGSLRQYLKENEASSKEHLSVKTDLEDLFEVVTLNDVSSGKSEKDFHMAVNNNVETDCVDIEKLLLSTTTNLRKDSNKFENALKDFNPEEEWKQLYELKDRVSSIYDMLPKLGSGISSSENQNATSSNLNAVESSNEFVYLSPNEVDDWLPRKRAKKDNVSNKCTLQSKCLSSLDGLLKKNSELEKNRIAKSCDQPQMVEIRRLSPAEIVQTEFSKYFVKDGIENWLSHN